MSDNWKLKDKTFTEYIKAADIQAGVQTLASQIEKDFEGKNPLFIIILNGAFIFAADLIKRVRIDCEVAFVKLSSYKGISSTGQVNEIIGLDVNIAGRSVIIVEDIVDSGLTLKHFIASVKRMKPAEINIATCLLKPEAFGNKFDINYSCFSIPNDFVVGYGLDYDGLGRNSEAIYRINS